MGSGSFRLQKSARGFTSEAESNLVEIGVACGFGDDRSRAAKVGALYPSGRDMLFAMSSLI